MPGELFFHFTVEEIEIGAVEMPLPIVEPRTINRILRLHTPIDRRNHRIAQTLPTLMRLGRGARRMREAAAPVLRCKQSGLIAALGA